MTKDPHREVEAAIARFRHWEYPWEFQPSVAAELTGESLEIFEKVWRNAVASEHWNEANLARCASRAEAAVAMAHPWLSPSSISALVRAASYSSR